MREPEQGTVALEIMPKDSDHQADASRRRSRSPRSRSRSRWDFENP